MKRHLKIAGIVLCVPIVLLLIVYLNKQNSTYTKKQVNQYMEAPVSSKETTLRVGTYNIKSLNMGEGLAAFQAEMEMLPLDIVALQEVDKNAFRSGNMDMVKEMATAAGFSYSYFYPTMWIIDGFYGLGILSKYPIQEVSSIPLPNSMIKEPRILAYANINVQGTEFHIYNTHLSYEDKDVREEQIDYLKEHITKQDNTILFGDFNTFKDKASFSIDGMQSIQPLSQGLYTFRGIASPDDIYYSNNLQIADMNIMESSFSDHHLLYTTITWK